MHSSVVGKNIQASFFSSHVCIEDMVFTLVSCSFGGEADGV